MARHLTRDQLLKQYGSISVHMDSFACGGITYKGTVGEDCLLYITTVADRCHLQDMAYERTDDVMVSELPDIVSAIVKSPAGMIAFYER
ncbi:hypothetical protein [Parendozoicomonas haliclonae]|uniref:Uncharacterized protein n=1 Tax=Parendozoicomonas haliclonae TaxID=1960125 RepID=A0A1X7ARM0_9GAMM|nr:hypothetical protein [Parendozoicomonas haliclonae]SMA50730.1 hypothetical protein EHSB41UT_04547 [Parendozoicomonas haliclonae]